MASHVFNAAKTRLWNGTIDLDTHDIRAKLLMTNTTADTEVDTVVFVGDLTTLDLMDGANYVDKALANEACATDDGNDRSEFDADDITWSSLGAGSRSVQGLLLYKFVTNDADSPLIAWIEFASPVAPDGSNFTIQFNAEGILQMA